MTPLFSEEGVADDILFAPDGRGAVVRQGESLRLLAWGRSEPQDVTVKLAAGRTVLAYSPDGRTVAAYVNGEVRLLDAVTGQQRRAYALPGPIEQLVFAPDGRHLAAAGDKAVYVLRLEKAGP